MRPVTVFSAGPTGGEGAVAGAEIAANHSQEKPFAAWVWTGGLPGL